MWKYKCISEYGDILLTTDNVEDAVKALCGVFGDPIPAAVLELGTDGEYHIATDL